MRGQNPGTGKRKKKKSTARKRTGVTGVKRRRRVGKASKSGTAVYNETYRRRRRSPNKGITRKTTSKSNAGKRKRMQTGKRQTAQGKRSDMTRKARYPGRRTASSGRRYTETRRNRSDSSGAK